MMLASVSRLSNHVLLRDTRTVASRARLELATLLVHLSEVEARRLYADEGCESMFAWCMRELHFSEAEAYRRIRAARIAREFPVLFAAIAEGRLHLTALVLLSPYLTRGNVEELASAATHLSRTGIEELLARRFPRPDVPTTIRPIAPPSDAAQLAPARVAPLGVESATPAAGVCERLAPGPVVPSGPPNQPQSMVPLAPTAVAKLTPLAPERFELRTTLDQEAHDLLREAQALLVHAIPNRDAAEVLKRVLLDWVTAQHRRKFAQVSKPRGRRSHADGRYVPAEVKREVRARDGGRCTFVGENGRRCESRERLELDHVTPVARGGRTSTENLRLRCRAHNQLEAEHAFGAGFMREKREDARRQADRTLPQRARDLARPASPRIAPALSGG